MLLGFKSLSRSASCHGLVEISAKDTNRTIIFICMWKLNDSMNLTLDSRDTGALFIGTKRGSSSGFKLACHTHFLPSLSRALFDQQRKVHNSLRERGREITMKGRHLLLLSFLLLLAGTTLPKGAARANQALVEGLNNEDRPFAISKKSRMFKGECVLRRSLAPYRGAPPGDHTNRPPGSTP